MQKSESIAELAAALSKAQGEFTGAKRTKVNPHLKSKYADLESCWEACREPLAKHGLAVVQMPVDTSDQKSIMLETMLVHASGQWIAERMSIPVNKADAQGVGSALTYARRYALCAMLGIAPDDDDGNTAANARPRGGDTSADAPAGLLDKAETAAREGIDVYRGFWSGLTAKQREAIGAQRHESYKALAAQVPAPESADA